MKVNAILPMRSGSQRIKNKNVTLVKGRPLYSFILDTLASIQEIDKIIINTDIESILDRYVNHPRIMIIKREESLRGNCDINWVIKDTLDKVAGDHFMQIHATNPLLSANTIAKAIATYFDNLGKHDSLFSVNKIQKRFWRKDGTPINHSLSDSPTTQNLEPYYEENSCIYLFSRDSFSKKSNRIGNKPFLFQTELIESLDIDTSEELRLFEMLVS